MKTNFFNSFFSKKRNIIICAVVLVVVIILCIFVFGNSGERKKNELENELKALGKDFYENFYYDLVVRDNGVETISKYSLIGIKVNLDNISRCTTCNTESIKKFVNPKTKKECDMNESKAIIYPKEPYGKTDYTIEAELSCGFEESK